jgi:PST family polysaccharide transporter
MARSEANRLVQIGSNLTGFQLINYVARNVDTLLVGRVLGAAALGIYSQAYRLMLFPVQNLTFVLSRALLPSLSRLQHDVVALRRLYFQMLRLTAFATLPLMCGLWVMRSEVIAVLLGAKWAPVADLLFWMAPLGFVQSIVSTTGAVFISMGATRTLFRLGLVGALLQLAWLPAGVALGGVEGLAASYLMANLVNALVLARVLSRQLALTHWRELGVPLLKPLTIGAVFVSGLVVFRFLFHGIIAGGPWSAILTITAFGASFYLALLWSFARTDFGRFLDIFRMRAAARMNAS